MKYPSEYLYALADKIDKVEDRVSEKLTDYDLDVWNWPRLRSEMQALGKQQEILLREYALLALRYEKQTGEKWSAHFSIFWPQDYVAQLMNAAVEGARKEDEATF